MPAPVKGMAPAASKKANKARGGGGRNKNPITSLKVFRQFIKRNPDGSLDATLINSPQCYEAWLASRKGTCRRPERFFQRTLTAHIGGTDGRTPFHAEEERAILERLRIKQRWPCFEKSAVRFGEQGFRGKGFHEKNAELGLAPVQPGEEEDDESEEEQPETGTRTKPASSSKSKRAKVDSDEDQTQIASVGTPRTAPTGIVARQTLSETLYLQALTENFTPESHAFRAEPHALFRTATLGLFNMFSGMQDTARQWWTSTLSWLRMRCLGRGWLPPTMDDAREALAEFSERYPGHYVHIFDFTAPRGEDRIMLQNEESRRLFGRISRHEGGFSGKRFLPQDAWSVLRTATRAFCYPGMELPTPLRWILTGQPGLRTALFTTTLYVDDPRRMVIEHGIMIEGTLTS